MYFSKAVNSCALNSVPFVEQVVSYVEETILYTLWNKLCHKLKKKNDKYW